jgi:hypothetical protein
LAGRVLLLSVVLLFSVSTFEFGVFDLVVNPLVSDASRRPELDVVLLAELPEPVKPVTSVPPLLFRLEEFCATLVEELRSLRLTFVPVDLL